MTKHEPAVEPAPIVKPGPSTTPKPKPKRGDPWTVPGPKVNPTPKAKHLRVMKKKMITDKRDYKALRKIMSHDDFFKKFDLSSGAVCGLLHDHTRDALKNEDRLMTAEEMKEFSEPIKATGKADFTL